MSKKSCLTMWAGLLALAASAAAAGCGGGASGPPLDTSELALAVENTPEPVRTLRVEIAGVRDVVRCEPLPTSGLRFTGLPAGRVVLRVSAHDTQDCAGTPLYQSQDRELDLRPGMVTVVGVVLLANGIVDLSISFERLGPSPDGGADGSGPEGGQERSLQVSNDPNDPRIARLAREGLSIVAYGTKDERGVATGVQVLEARHTGDPPVVTQLDGQNGITGFTSDGLSVSIVRAGDGSLMAHVEGAAFPAYDVPIRDWPFGPMMGLPPPIPAAAPSPDPMDDGAQLLAAAPGGGQAIAVDVSRCGAPDNRAIVNVSVTTRDGTRIDTIAARTGTTGRYQVGLQLQSGPAETFEAACQGLATAAGITCDLLEGVPQESDPGVCAVISALANVTSPGAYAVCLTALKSARLFCLATQAPVPPGGGPDIPALVCDEITDALMSFSDYPATAFAYARVPGSARTYSSPGLVLHGADDAPAPLAISIDDGTCNPPPPAACTYGISPETVSIPAEGGEVYVQITTSRADCAWVAAADASWLATSSGPASGSRAVSISAARNTTRSARVGHVELLQLGQRITINQPAPPSSSCTFQVQPTSRTVAAAGETLNVTITASDPTCAWQIQGLSAWTSVPVSTGAGSRTVPVTVAANPSSTARLASLSVAGQTVTLSQPAGATQPPLGNPCAGLTITPSSLSFGEQGGVGRFNVNAPAGCSWIATSSSPVPTIRGGWMGFGPGVVEYSVSLNVGPARQAIINVGSATHTISQSGASLYCAFGLSYTSRTFPASGGSATVDVAANFGLCQWTAKTTSSFISLGAPLMGLDRGTISYSVAPNPSTEPRVATIVVVNAVLTIQQEGLAPCNFAITPQRASVPASGGKVGVQIAAARSDCAWTIVPGDSQVRVAGSTSGRGPAAVELVVEANPASTSRSFAVQIAGQTVTIDQAGSPSATVPLTITQSGNGTIAIQGGPASQLCSTASCTFLYPAGAEVTLTPAGGGPLVSWSQDCAGAPLAGCTLVMTAPRAAGATFGSTTTPELVVDARGIGATFVMPPRAWVQGGEVRTFSVAEGTQVRLSSIGQIAEPYGGACAPAGRLRYCTVTVRGRTTVVIPFATRADAPQVPGNVRTLSFGTVGVGQTKQVVERWMPPSNLRFSFLSRQEREDFVRLNDVEPAMSIGGFSLPYGSYFTWPAVRNGQNVMFQMAPNAASAGAGQAIALPLYWWYESLNVDNVIMLTGTAVP